MTVPAATREDLWVGPDGWSVVPEWTCSRSWWNHTTVSQSTLRFSALGGNALSGAEAVGVVVLVPPSCVWGFAETAKTSSCSFFSSGMTEVSAKSLGDTSLHSSVLPLEGAIRKKWLMNADDEISFSIDKLHMTGDFMNHVYRPFSQNSLFEGLVVDSVFPKAV